MHKSLRSFIKLLEKEKEIVKVEALVDPDQELAEIHRRVVEEQGPALLFTKVKGSPYPVVTNLFGTPRRVELAMGPRPEAIIKKAVKGIEVLLPPKLSSIWREKEWLLDLIKVGLRKVEKSKAPVLDCHESNTAVDLNKLPALVSWPEDGGRFLTLPLVYTEHPLTGEHNLGMYRVQIYSAHQTGMHWQIHKGGGFHYYEAEQLQQPLPVTVFLGGPPALIMSAIAALPEAVPELIFASFLMGDKLNIVKTEKHVHSLVAEAEFALCGEVPPKVRRPEGPFGDHYGYYSLTHDFPVFNVKTVFHRKDAIFPATVVGKPKQEDYYIGEFFQNLLAPIYPLIMPGVKDLWTYAETGFHSLAAAVVRESYYREALSSAFRILGEGQLSLTKFLLITDVSCNLRQFSQLLERILERFRPEQDLLIINDTAMDTLDYTGRKFNQGNKAIMLGLGKPIRSLPFEYRGDLPCGVRKAKPFCGGCLLVSSDSFEKDPELGMRLAKESKAQLGEWPLVIIVDKVEDIYDQTSFLWTVFTRFDPGFDIYAESSIQLNKICYTGPIIIDARMKPPYPGEVLPRQDIVNRVSQRWGELFKK